MAQLLNENVQKDTVCFKFSYNPGDTLIYQVYSADSISIDYGTPLIKERFEKIRIVCDSVSDRGTFFLTHEMISYRSYEKELGSSAEKVKREDHPWVGKKAYIEIDSLGKRLNVSNTEEPLYKLAPGGGFQPYILFPINESCKAIGESWFLDETTDDLVENANPGALLRYSCLFRARDPIDTLGYECNAFEYIKTGQGSLTTVYDLRPIKVSNVINSFGKMYVGKNINKPVHYYATIEQKLKFHFSKDEEIPIFHYVSSEFTLLKFISGKESISD